MANPRGSNLGSESGVNTPSDIESVWLTEEEYWRNNYGSRPYASADRGFEFYRPAYRYGIESARRFHGKQWNEVEPELARGWETFKGGGWAEFKGERKAESTWESVKAAVRDAWDRITGSSDRAAKREMAEHMNPNVNPERGAR
jgi:hypothetical protein